MGLQTPVFQSRETSHNGEYRHVCTDAYFDLYHYFVKTKIITIGNKIAAVISMSENLNIASLK